MMGDRGGRTHTARRKKTKRTPKMSPKKTRNPSYFFFATDTDLLKQEEPDGMFRCQLNLSELAVRQMEEN